MVLGDSVTSNGNVFEAMVRKLPKEIRIALVPEKHKEDMTFFQVSWNLDSKGSTRWHPMN